MSKPVFSSATNIFILLLILCVIIFIYKKNSLLKMMENYQNYQNYNTTKKTHLGSKNKIGRYLFPQSYVLVEDTYPVTGSRNISNNEANDIWWHWPTFKVGSYAQITNNIKYPNNPDVGQCMPSSFCGALYKEKQTHTNYTHVLPPVNSGCKTRVGYFATDVNLLI